MIRLFPSLNGPPLTLAYTHDAGEKSGASVVIYTVTHNLNVFIALVEVIASYSSGEKRVVESVWNDNVNSYGQRAQNMTPNTLDVYIGPDSLNAGDPTVQHDIRLYIN